MTKKAIEDAFEHLRPGEEMAAARGRRALALGGRLARGHERHPRRVDPPARRLRRRRLARPRPDADARAASPAARRRSAPSSPSPYWLVEADFAADERAPLRRPLPRRQADRRGRGGEDRREVDATSAARSRSSRRRRSASARSSSTTSPRSSATPTRCFGFSARRTLGAAQKLYEEHKAITYPRTNSRFLPSDLIPEIKPTAELVGPQPAVRARAPST